MVGFCETPRFTEDAENATASLEDEIRAPDEREKQARKLLKQDQIISSGFDQKIKKGVKDLSLWFLHSRSETCNFWLHLKCENDFFSTKTKLKEWVKTIFAFQVTPLL